MVVSYCLPNMLFLNVTAAEQMTIYSPLILITPNTPSTATSDNMQQCSGYNWQQFALKCWFRFISTNPEYFQTFKANGSVSEEQSAVCKTKDLGSETDQQSTGVGNSRELVHQWFSRRQVAQRCLLHWASALCSGQWITELQAPSSSVIPEQLQHRQILCCYGHLHITGVLAINKHKQATKYQKNTLCQF